jgi:hypothetical protein
MYQVDPAHTADWSLGQFVDQISHHAAVDGVLLMGTTGGDRLRPTSDYDVLIVLDGPPIPHVGITIIDGRLADLVFTTAAVLDRLTVPVIEQWQGPLDGALLRWTAAGTIAHDRSGRLARLRDVAAAGQTLPAWEPYIYQQWFRLNYNLLHNQRMIQSADPVVLAALDLRLLYCLADVMTAYFVVRRIPWEGEKNAIRYWQAHDSAFWTLYRGALDAGDRAEKLAGYAELAAGALAPVGGLWAADVTALLPSDDTDYTPAGIDALLTRWAGLFDPDVAQDAGTR